MDRFGLSVNVETLQDVAQRTQMVMDRITYEQNPDELVEQARPAQVRVNLHLPELDSIALM